MKRIDLVHQLSRLGHDVQPATLTKWLRVYGEETGQVQGKVLGVGVGETIIAAVTLLRNGETEEIPMTFREALGVTLDRLEQAGPGAARGEQVPGGSGLGADHASVLAEVLRHGQAQVVTQEAMLDVLRTVNTRLETIEAKLELIERREPAFDLDESLEILAGARQSLALARGFSLFEASEGPVLMPRPHKFVPVPLEDPEPGSSWWRRGWEWVLGRITVRQAS